MIVIRPLRVLSAKNEFELRYDISFNLIVGNDVANRCVISARCYRVVLSLVEERGVILVFSTVTVAVLWPKHARVSSEEIVFCVCDVCEIQEIVEILTLIFCVDVPDADRIRHGVLSISKVKEDLLFFVYRLRIFVQLGDGYHTHDWEEDFEKGAEPSATPVDYVFASQCLDMPNKAGHLN
jgi:hypothetical protein